DGEDVEAVRLVALAHDRAPERQADGDEAVHDQLLHILGQELQQRQVVQQRVGIVHRSSSSDAEDGIRSATDRKARAAGPTTSRRESRVPGTVAGIKAARYWMFCSPRIGFQGPNHR